MRPFPRSLFRHFSVCFLIALFISAGSYAQRIVATNGANNSTNDVSVIDIATRRVVQTYKVGEGPHGLSFHSSGMEAYTSNIFGNTVSVIRFDKK